MYSSVTTWADDRVVSAGFRADIIRRVGEVRTQSVTHSFTGPEVYFKVILWDEVRSAAQIYYVLFE